jgi:hypothetical protein
LADFEGWHWVLIQGTSEDDQLETPLKSLMTLTAVNDNYHIRSLNSFVDTISEPEPRSMIGGEAHVTSTSIQNSNALDSIRKLNQFRNRSMVSTSIASNNQRLLRLNKSLRYSLDRNIRQSSRLNRIPKLLLKPIRCQILLHNLPRTTQIDWTSRITAREL